MKIIAKTNCGYIVNIESTELRKLTDYHYNPNKDFNIGANIKIASLYEQLKALACQSQKIKKISHALKTAAGILEKIDPVFYEGENSNGK